MKAWDFAPGLADLRGYRRSSLGPDVTAGVTVAAVAVPSGLGMGELAGVSPIAGLYAASIPLLGYALFGSSRQLIVGPVGAVSAVTATSVAGVAGSDDPARVAAVAAVLAALVGLTLIVSALLKLGFMAEFLSSPVLLGYINGVAVLIIAGQTDKLLGISVEARNFVPRVLETVLAIPKINWWTVLLSAVLIGMVLVLKKLVPKFPGMLAVVVFAGGASALFGFSGLGIAVVGEVPGGFPVPQVSGVTLDDVFDLTVPALGLALIAYGDSMAIARTYAEKHRYEINADRELLGLGAGNLAAGLFQGIPIGGSGSKTALNDASRGQTPLVGIIVAVLSLVV